ncbi:MAG: electron transport complex subunit RsxG [Kangiellaceae bacterium]
MQNDKKLLGVAIKKNAVILAVFAMASTATVALVYQFTKDKIAQEVERVMNQQLNTLVDANQYNNQPNLDCILIADHKEDSPHTINKIFRMRKNQQPIAAIFSVTATNGYSGNIDMMVAFSTNQMLLGIAVLNHSETPGLGDKIESHKSEWSRQFDNISLSNKNDKSWRVKKDGGDFDALTGATITPRAVIGSIHESVKYFLNNQSNIFEMKANCPTNQ